VTARQAVLAEDGPVAAGEAEVGGAEQAVLLRDGQAHVEYLAVVCGVGVVAVGAPFAREGGVEGGGEEGVHPVPELEGEVGEGGGEEEGEEGEERQHGGGGGAVEGSIILSIL